ncbi:hypothetical protein JXA02_07115 [candidate division KSB1 bacterium]|nr:hypothetical protein [candidate division KSB1 bacterium]RQW06666.1 MAG: hypothetical protein EH222_08290 [candidate division KSB1 bacterium]
MTNDMKFSTLRLILGDQLNRRHSWFRAPDEHVLDPDALDAWYLGIYIDAIEWVEITNTRGMVYRTWDRMADSARGEIRRQAEKYLQDIERL